VGIVTDSAPAPRSQTSYQVRFEWGAAGAAAVAVDADVVAWIDELGAEPAPAGVRPAALADAADFAQWCLARQEELGGRFRIAVVAAGATQPDGSLRFAVEDLLGAGAVIDAIAEVGIDHQSPEAAAAAAAYVGLRRATTHLVNASVSAREARATPPVE
jgi:2-phosphosulfolactate phosphatase